MAVSLTECEHIVDAVEQANVIFAIGHVLRYTPYSRMFRQLVVDDAIVGDVVSMCHEEGVGYAHAAHSYVRGSWRREDESSPILLAKSCHDIDWITWLLPGAKCTRVASFGSLRHFAEQSKPSAAGNATRCCQCPLERTCAYSATRMYTGDGLPGYGGAQKWAAKIVDGNGAPVSADASDDQVLEALATGPYGRCVYHCDNDVLDNQVVVMQFSNGASVSFTLCAFSEQVCVRRTRVFGSRGELNGDGIDTVRHFDFETATTTEYKVDQFEFAKQTTLRQPAANSKLTGHGGGDFALMRDFIDAVAHNDTSRLSATPRETLHSHRLVFEAERARIESKQTLEW